MFSQILQELTQMHRKEAAVMEVYSRSHTIWLLELSNVGAAETYGQICRRQQELERSSGKGCGRLCEPLMRPLCSSVGDFKLDAILSQHWFLVSHNHMPFHISYISLFQSQDLLHHNMACTIYLGLSICLQLVNLAAHRTWMQSEDHEETLSEWTLTCTW